MKLKMKLGWLFFFVIILFNLFSHPQENWSVREVKAAGSADERIFSRPVDLETAGSRIFILDNQERTIRVFSSEGKWLDNIGRYGQGPDEFIHPADMSILENEIAVLDSEARRVQLYALNGAYLGGFKIGFRGYRIVALSKDIFSVSRLPSWQEKNAFLVYGFNRQGKEVFRSEKASSTGKSAEDFFHLGHILMKADGKIVMLKFFGAELAIFLDENGKRIKVLRPGPDYPVLQFKAPLSRGKNLQALFWASAIANNHFYLVCSGKTSDSDIGPSNRVSVLDFDGHPRGIITFPITINKLALLGNRFFIIDEAGDLRLFDLIKGNDN